MAQDVKVEEKKGVYTVVDKEGNALASYTEKGQAEEVYGLEAPVASKSEKTPEKGAPQAPKK